MEPAEESPECNVEFAVCESVNMSVRRLREEKGGKRVAKSYSRHAHTHCPAASEWNHVMIQPPSVLDI